MYLHLLTTRDDSAIDTSLRIKDQTIDLTQKENSNSALLDLSDETITSALRTSRAFGGSVYVRLSGAVEASPSLAATLLPDALSTLINEAIQNIGIVSKMRLTMRSGNETYNENCRQLLAAKIVRSLEASNGETIKTAILESKLGRNFPQEISAKDSVRDMLQALARRHPSAAVRQVLVGEIDLKIATDARC